MADTQTGVSYRVGTLALAACAGAIDLVALAGLGHAFASVITGNLVTTGLGGGKADISVLTPPAVAVAGYAAGVACWQRLWRHRPDALRGQLVTELGLLVGVTGGWIGTHTHPNLFAAHILLALASMAMGGQSTVALRLHASTTYMTGTLTGAVHDLVTGESDKRSTAFGQLAALFTGAAAAGALFAHIRWSAPLPSVALLILAIGVLPAGRRHR